MIEDKWLADVKFTTVHSGADLSRVQSVRGDFQTSALSNAVNNAETNDITVRSWLATANDRKSTLVFCVDLAHVSALTATFRSHGTDARFITGDTQTRMRAERLAAFKAKKFPVLLNCGIFTEGTDIPNIDCIILARPTKSRNLLIQMVGRGLRKATGKDDCHVIDMVASLEKGIVTTPTLFGLDPQELVKDADADEMKALKDGKESERQREENATDTATNQQSGASTYNGNITFTHYDNVNTLIENTSGEHHIRGTSHFAWVQVDHNRYILSNSTGSFLTLRIQDRKFQVTSTSKIPKQSGEGWTPYMRPIVIATASTFDDAIHAADTFAKAKFIAQFILTSAPWRRARATPEQVAFLNKFREEGKKLHVNSIAKGRAADWITKIKHGARGRVKKMKSETSKARRAREKEEEWQERQKREQVKVGPLES